jgi:RNA polymerase sigma-32 factor
LFFNLRSMKQRFKGEDMEAELSTHRETLSEAQIDAMAEALHVKREEVVEMEARMSGGDVLLDPTPSDDGEDSFGPIAYLTNAADQPDAILEARHRDELSSQGLKQALEVLDARSRHIVEERWLKVNDDNTGGMTLHDLAAVYGVSAERIRQIEGAAMKKMKQALLAYQ